MTITSWPVVGRDRLVRAFRPGERTSAEAPFRTLRAHKWATQGVRVNRRKNGRLAGQTTIFSALNVESARLARHGMEEEAVRIAILAATLEAGPEFARLRGLLDEAPSGVADAVMDGELPAEANASLAKALKAVARRTEALRRQESSFSLEIEILAGRVTEIHESYVLLAHVGGPITAVPKWLAVSARRGEIGALLVLVMDRLDDMSALIDAAPGIALEDDSPEVPYSPFGRHSSRSTRVSSADARLLSRAPAPLSVMVPVVIEE